MSLSITVANTQTRLQVSRHEQPANDVSPVSTSPAPSQGVDASGSSAATSLSALLGALGTSGEPQETAGATPAAAASEPVSFKPNLDALHRVLAHYAAQSAAADTIISLVKP